MNETVNGSRPRDARWTLAALMAIGLLARGLAAVEVDRLAARRGTLCLFPDANIYWGLGRAIRLGEPYSVPLYNQPHLALRVPGYPLFLALGQQIFVESTLLVRLVQAVLGAGCVGLVYALARRVIVPPGTAPPAVLGRWTVPLLAAALAAVEPYTVAISAFLLSEALFLPLMLASLWGIAMLWEPRSVADTTQASWRLPLAFGTGAVSALAVLTKPSWALFPPVLVVAWLLGAGRGKRTEAFVCAVVLALGFVATMTPWWVRNASIYGQFVPTALWAGASLYDGLNPSATGASDMRFLDDPQIRVLDEQTQNAVLKQRALAFARSHPGRVVRLMLVKAARFWSPWPNEASFRHPLAIAASAVVMVPLEALLLVGLWDRRWDVRALILLAGPLLYFAAIHMVFVSSVRYRIPGFAPAFGLVAIGVGRLSRRRFASPDTPPAMER